MPTEDEETEVHREAVETEVRQDDGAVRVLDVRDREEPPFPAIDAALSDLPPDGRLVLVNGFEPEPLYDVLERRGFAYRSEQVAEGAWRVVIERA